MSTSVSIMESEPDRDLDARAQLRAFTQGSHAAESEAHVPTPLWFWPVIALAAPLAVAVQRLDGLLRVLVVVLLAVPIVAVSIDSTRRERQSGAVGKAPIRGGRFIFWKVPALFCMIMGLQMTWLLGWSSGPAVAVFTYLVIAVGSTFFWRKADQQLAALTSERNGP